MEKTVGSLPEFEAEAARWAASLAAQASGATLVTLSGELGAGKTAFTKAAAKALGVDETVTSPTFVLEKIYLLPEGAFRRLVHIDAYRLEGGSEIAPLGFDELMQDAGNLIMLEWPEKVSGGLPPPSQAIRFAVAPEGSHTISYGEEN